MEWTGYPGADAGSQSVSRAVWQVSWSELVFLHVLLLSSVLSNLCVIFRTSLMENRL